MVTSEQNGTSPHRRNATEGCDRGRRIRGEPAATAGRGLPDAGLALEAEDAVQETWLRLHRADTSEVDNLRAWLTTVVARVSLDMLRSRRSRREEPLEARLPEPIVDRRPGGGGAAGRRRRARAAGRARDADAGGAARVRPARPVRACRSRRSRRSWTAPRPPRDSSRAAPGAACAARRRSPTPTSAASARSSTRSSPPRARATSRRCWPCSTPRSSCASTAAARRRSSAARAP